MKVTTSFHGFQKRPHCWKVSRNPRIISFSLGERAKDTCQTELSSKKVQLGTWPVLYPFAFCAHPHAQIALGTQDFGPQLWEIQVIRYIEYYIYIYITQTNKLKASTMNGRWMWRSLSPNLFGYAAECFNLGPPDLKCKLDQSTIYYKKSLNVKSNWGSDTTVLPFLLTLRFTIPFEESFFLNRCVMVLKSLFMFGLSPGMWIYLYM